MNPYYNQNFNYDFNKNPDGDRFILAAPFLFGALAGGAIVGLTRPRPVFVYPPYPTYPAMPYGNYRYNTYYNYRPY